MNFEKSIIAHSFKLAKHNNCKYVKSQENSLINLATSKGINYLY